MLFSNSVKGPLSLVFLLQLINFLKQIFLKLYKQQIVPIVVLLLLPT